jgi:hypothetical protein
VAAFLEGREVELKGLSGPHRVYAAVETPGRVRVGALLRPL